MTMPEKWPKVGVGSGYGSGIPFLLQNALESLSVAFFGILGCILTENKERTQ